MLQLYYNFFDKFCHVNKFEEFADSLFLFPAVEYLYDCICQEKKDDWQNLRKNDCRDSFRADLKTDFFFH